MRLLIIGSLDGQLGTASRMAMAKGAKVSQVDSVDAAMVALRSGRGADLLMVDVRHDIAHLVGQLQDEHIHITVVACGIASDTRAAVAAIRAGAKEYIPLPPDAALIAAILEAVTTENHALIHRDPAMGNVMRLADQIAGSEASILIAGESGTGKEVLARYVHRKSRRAEAPFVSVNCAAIPESLLESELFGHEKGAFTGAVSRRIDKFEEANGGTLLLDEISEMDVRLQAKLLRAIQEREIDRVGGSRPVKIDIRLIATTNRDLVQEVAKGTFREDLMFRINVMTLLIPPLRKRPEDIMVLADHFARRYSEANAVPLRSFAAETRRLLLGHQWQGNVRELENTVHRAVLLASGSEIGPDAILLPDGSRPQAAASPRTEQVLTAGAAPPGEAGALTRGLVGKTVAEVERDLILDTLNHCLGNRTHAANILGISIRTLRNKLKQYDEEGTVVPLTGNLRHAAY